MTAAFMLSVDWPNPLFFEPLRNRILAIIDRRFYHKKYDVQQVRAQFAIMARDETDMNALTAELAQVVQETVEPDRVKVWLNHNQVKGAEGSARW